MEAVFEALNEGVLVVPSDLPCIFLQSKPSFMNIVFAENTIKKMSATQHILGEKRCKKVILAIK